MILFPMFIILCVVHGSGTFLNYGFPFTLPFLTIPFVLYLVQTFKRYRLWCGKEFEIIDVSVLRSKEMVLVHFKRPADYTFLPGQYVFINVPSISRYQWHPFSIASSPHSDRFMLMIKNAGDWTKEFI